MKNSNFFYGYIIVTSAFFIQMMAFASNRTFGVFLEPMLNELGWNRASISGAYTMVFVINAFAGIAAGRLTDRIGPKLILICCGILFGTGYILSSFISAVWQFYLFYGVITGIALSGASAPVLSVVTRWFHKKRAFMTGIITSGPALGNVVLPLVFTILINIYNWRISFIILGIMTLVIILCSSLFLKRDPGQMGLQPYGYQQENNAAVKPSQQNTGFSLGEAIRTNQFWLLAVICFCDFLLVNLVSVHIVSHTISLGFTPTIAASILSTAAAVSIPARIIVGGIADRIGNRKALIMLLITPVFAFIALLTGRELWTLYLFAVLYGIGLWSSFVVMSPLVGEHFGLKSHGTIFAAVLMFHMFGGAIGPILAGFIFDVTGSYQLAFFLCLIFAVSSLTAIICLRPIKHKVRSAAEPG